MSEEHGLQVQTGGKPSFWQNALRTLKGESTESLMEQFTSEMTLVAEGLSEDQSRLSRDLQAMHRRVDELQDSLAEDNDRSRQKLQAQLDAMETELAEDNRRFSEQLENLERRLDALDKRTAPKKTHRWKLGSLSSAGLIPQLTLLAGIVVGGWVLVTILNLFK